LVRAVLSTMKDGKSPTITVFRQLLNHSIPLIEQAGKSVLFSTLGKVKTEEDKADKTLRPYREPLRELLG